MMAMTPAALMNEKLMVKSEVNDALNALDTGDHQTPESDNCERKIAPVGTRNGNRSLFFRLVRSPIDAFMRGHER